MQDPNLPWGVTSYDTDGYDPICGNCGHLYSDHYETDEEMDNTQFNYKGELIESLLNSDGHHESSQIEYNADGTVSHACDCTRGGKTQEERLKNQCGCIKFNDGYYEPEWEKDE